MTRGLGVAPYRRGLERCFESWAGGLGGSIVGDGMV